MIQESGSTPSGKERGIKRGCIKWGVFIGRSVGQKIISKRKERIISGKITFPWWEGQRILLCRLPHLLWGKGEGPCPQMTSLGLIRKFPIDRLRLTFLGEIETAVGGRLSGLVG